MAQAPATTNSSMTHSTPWTRSPLLVATLRSWASPVRTNPSVGKCRNKTETVVCRQGTVTLLEDQGLRDLGGSQIVSDHALMIKALPFPVREVKDFRSPYGQRNDQSVRQVAKDPKQSLLYGGRSDRKRH